MTDTLAPPVLTAEEVHAKMRHLRYARQRIAEEIATCDADRRKLQDELELIAEHQERVTKDDREFAAMLERELEAHLLNLRATDDRIKSVRTPWGDIASRVQQPEFKRDEDVLFAWADEYDRANFVKVTTHVSLNWEQLKKECHVNGDRLVLGTGEVVPGVEVIKRGPKVSVELVP